MQQYLEGLKKESELAQTKYQIEPKTIFWGGGTPSALSLSQLETLFSFWPWQNAQEITFETNPDTISDDKAEILLKHGINRISLGVQSMDEKHLKLLERTHRPDEVRETFQRLRRVGFKNISIDLMFSLPHQTLQEWKQTVEDVIALQPDHISCYNLTYEEDTPFLKLLENGEHSLDPERDREMFLWTEERLLKEGFVHYEISNYAKPGFESTHNIAYWEGKDYLGFGPGAFSTIDLQRLHTIDNTDIYSAQLIEKNHLVQDIEPLTEKTKKFERIMLGLRQQDGIPVEWIKSWKNEVSMLEQEELITLVDGRILLTPKGKLLADSIAEVFI
jgi:oxygen-independent coproporphyrinogen-3 oxidase